MLTVLGGLAEFERSLTGRAVQAAFTALTWVLIPVLRLGDKPQDRPMTV